MRVYTVCCGTIRLDHLSVFGGMDGAPVSVVTDREQADGLAIEYARKHPGETFYVVEGELRASYQAELLPVITRAV